ncbi:MAG: DUF4421 family protein [Paludibacteraceae bacterium]|nr:DUF4421 family protein [Paludibacteraceae bacterium]
MRRVWGHRTIVALLLICGSACCAYAKTAKNDSIPKRPNKGTVWIYRVSEWIDHYVMKDLDTAYIGLPEHSWRIAYTNGMVGVNSTLTSYSETPVIGNTGIMLLNKTTPSVDLGFNVGFRGFGFGYSWDAINAYAQRLSFSLGSKSIGIDFAIQTSKNIATQVFIGTAEWKVPNNNVVITNANLNVWYALNSAHYSHQAAVKQSYIQKKTAGSLLLHVAYMSSQVALSDTMKIPDAKRPLLPSLMNGLSAIRTRQIAAGIGYGINYTPNNGKVILHASAAALLVTYTVNLASFYMPDSIRAEMPDEAMFNMHPSFPVHVTGNMRAAISWEINKWVHLNAWATAENIRFKSSWTANDNYVKLSNWDWKVQVAVGVRLGAGYKRRQQVLDLEEQYLLAEENEILRRARKHKQDSLLVAQAAEIQSIHAESDSIAAQQLKDAQEALKQGTKQSANRKRRMRHTKLPQWITEYFYSPRP